MSSLTHVIATWAVLALPLAVASPLHQASAQVRTDTLARSDSAQQIPVLRVSAPYVPRVVGNASAVTVTLDSTPLGTVAPALGDVLRRLPFLYVRQNSRGEQELSVRGSESRQAAVLFEGVPLALTWDARADVSTIPLAGVQRIDYVRGLSSLLAGPNAIGGMVTASLWEHHTADSPPDQVRRAEVQADLFGGARASVLAGGPVRHSAKSSVQWRVGAGWRDLPGVARPHGVAEPSGNRTLRLNTDNRAVDAFFGARYQHAQGRYLSAFATMMDGDRGVAPELHLAAPRLWRNPAVRRHIAGIAAGTGALRSRLGIGDMELSLGVNDGLTMIESFADARYETVSATERDDDRTVTARLTFDQQLGAKAIIRGAVTQSSVRYLESVNRSASVRYAQRLASVATELDLNPTRFVTLTVGVAHDAANTYEAGGREPLGRKSGVGWRTGGTWLLPVQGVRLHASASERQRFPALRELYAGALNRFVPNPALRPELARSAEAGVSVTRGAWDAQAVVFAQRIDDAVVRVTLPDARFQRVNRDRFSSRGLELTAGAMVRGATVRGDITVQRARITDATLTNATQRYVEDVPAVFGSLLTLVPLPRGVDGQLRVRWLGETRCSNPASGVLVAQGGNYTLDTGVERRWNRAGMLGRITAMVQLENVLDRALYDKCGLPQAGRTVRVGVRLG